MASPWPTPDTMQAMELEATHSWQPRISVHLRIRVARGRQGDLHKFLADAIPFYESPGGIRVRLLSDSNDPDRFIELVEYIDEETYREDDQRVSSDPTMALYLARWRELLAEPPVVEVYREARQA
jgi:hypothetical protein